MNDSKRRKGKSAVDSTVSVSIMPGKVIEYFDSFGIPSIDSNINRALTSFKIVAFKKTIQNASSQLCGLYCSKYDILPLS